jgi:diaminopimelate epimerase
MRYSKLVYCLQIHIFNLCVCHINHIVYFVQASPRGGIVNIHLDEQNQRVLLQGKAVTVMEGSLLV